MVIIHGGKIINAVPCRIDKVREVLVKRKQKYSFERHVMVNTDELEFILHYRNNYKVEPGTYVSEHKLYNWDKRDLHPGDVIQQGELTITIEDISKIDSDSRKEFYCERLSKQLNDMVMLDKNLK